MSKLTVDILVIEIGSTITKVNAFGGFDQSEPCHLGQGSSLTTVDTDIMLGVNLAVEDLHQRLGRQLTIGQRLANSSAAGGLKMTVHGLTKDMTARAAKEASLGAGAVVRYLTAGKITDRDLKQIEKTQPNLLLLSGGVDYGESDITLQNAEQLKKLNLPIPLLYAGNCILADEIRAIFSSTQFKLYIADNVFPAVDQFNILPARHIIQKIFQEHIIHAKGMSRLQETIISPIIPTPLAVLRITEALAESDMDDILVIDVGGATTDIHSVTEGEPANIRFLASPEPRSKRTVEGDLGVYINAENVKTIFDESNPYDTNPYDLTLLKPMPSSENEIYLSRSLTEKAVRIAVRRHAGRFATNISLSDTNKTLSGKDLTAIKHIIGTGGALTRLEKGKEILEEVKSKNARKIALPPPTAQTYIDQRYIFSSCGTLIDYAPDIACKLAKKSIGFY